MRSFRILVITLTALMTTGVGRAEAQNLPWVIDGTLGYAGFVDEATDHFFVVAGTIRKHVTPRISIGPEFALMTSDGLTDRVVMLKGNVVFDVFPAHGPDARRVTPFLVGGVGGFWSRQQLVTGPFWASDPAFTAGGGIRARIGAQVSVAGEYRIGWELHQRLTASLNVEFN